MLKYESNTSYFEASSAWVQFLDGSTASYSSSNENDENENDTNGPELAVRFGEMPIGHFIQLYKADQDPNGYMEQEMHVYLEPYPPWKLYPHNNNNDAGDEALYEWQFNTNWYTPAWRWEWIFWRQLSGRANLPAGYDLLQCDRLDFSNGVPSKPPARMILNDVLIGTYLNNTATTTTVTTAPEKERRIYRPCGSHGTCRIIANQVYCGGLPPTWKQLAPFRPLMFAIVSMTILYRLRKKQKKQQQQQQQQQHGAYSDDTTTAELVAINASSSR